MVAAPSEETPPTPIELGARPFILLGAGASVEAGVPATFAMTDELAGRVGRMAYNRDLAQALNFVCATLAMYDAANGRSRDEGLDVERVFSAVELLAERHTLEVTPFVASWHPAVDGWDRPRSPSFFDKDLERAVSTGRGAKSLVEDLIRSVTGVGSGETYRHLTREMIRELRALVATREKDVGYLTPLANAARQMGGLWVATLNYDLAVEQVGNTSGVSVHTGIDDWIEDRRWHWDSTQGLKLLKLHGSIDWCWSEPETPEGHMRIRTVELSEEPESEQAEPVLVFGQRGKLQSEGPFLSLLAEFEAALSKASRLIVIGCSFRDPHINDIVRRWTRDDQGREIVLVDPAVPDTLSFADFRYELIRSLQPSMGGRPSDLPDRFELRQEPASKALASLSWDSVSA